MTPDTCTFSLSTRGGIDSQPVLAGAHASGRLDGVMFELTLRQTFRNPGSHPLEVIYSFTLPAQAVLLGFATELQGDRLEGRVVAKAIAEREYEDALASGDAPVMLECQARGLYTANIGNLAPGEEVVLELRMTQVLSLEQGRIRLAIPMTIAPRYGQAERAGLQAQQVPPTSLTAEYPLTASVVVCGALSGAVIDCPTHRFKLASLEGAVQLDLDERAWLDRDVVITVTPREPRPSLLITARDDVAAQAPTAAMALLQPQKAPQRPRIALKLLVDCSSSMAGDGIHSARRALRGLLGSLRAGDSVMLSRFGSTVEHLISVPVCHTEGLGHLSAAIDGIEADLGGTEMARALQAVLALSEAQGHPHADILLITDGAIWQADEFIAAASASGHRVFAIGVGAAPAEGLLRAVAEATGGACEFATAGEALEAAAARMLVRIRQEPWSDLQVDWGVQPIWQTATPRHAFADDTLIAYAGLPTGGAGTVVRLLAKAADGTSIELARSEADAPCAGDALARLAAARRLANAPAPEQRALAVDYQLMSDHTNCVLVHRRAQPDKVAEVAHMHRVSSMAPAGWSSLRASTDSAFQRHCDRPEPARKQPLFSMRSEYPAFSVSLWDDNARREWEPAADGSLDLTQCDTLRALKDRFAQHLASGDPWSVFEQGVSVTGLHPAIRQAIDVLLAMGLSPQQGWLLLAYWVQIRAGETSDPDRDSTIPTLALRIDQGQLSPAIDALDRMLMDYGLDDWSSIGEQRRKRLMKGALT